MVTSESETWEELVTLAEPMSKHQFEKTIDIWNSNPHSVNQRVHSFVEVLNRKLEPLEDEKLLSIISSICTDVSEYTSEQFCTLFKQLGLTISSDQDSNTEVLVKKLLPKNSKRFSISFELVIIDRSDGWAVFAGLPVQNGLSLLPKFPYKLWHKTGVTLGVPSSLKITDPSLVWLKKCLLPQLQKWALAQNIEDGSESVETGLPTKSHALISTEKYAEVYQNLKSKYGREMVKIWPECTDPAKFVYEDVAIASYILLLWEEKKPVSYVDLGCGNGLLVHILNSEGHNGIGVDLRRRKIWDLYPESTKLEVRSITPSDDSLFPETDWLIGNHSDELTPWIPVIAARSSQHCNFFVLPCCPYDFDGLKYRRKNAHMSQYADFLLYVKQISEKCGFKTDMDRMRIPSTKRICLVGRNRTYPANEWNSVNSIINQMIDSGCRNKLNGSKKNAQGEEAGGKNDLCPDNGWVVDFKPREAIERVKNCTRVDETLLSDIVSLTVNHLLVKRRVIAHPQDPSKTWNAGSVAAFNEIVPLISPEKLKHLKSECGGLQTLFRNHHQVFLVQKGHVQLRTPTPKSLNTTKIPVRSKPCWFFNNHPDGCLLDGSECAYKHEA